MHEGQRLFAGAALASVMANGIAKLAVDGKSIEDWGEGFEIVRSIMASITRGGIYTFGGAQCIPTTSMCAQFGEIDSALYSTALMVCRDDPHCQVVGAYLQRYPSSVGEM